MTISVTDAVWDFILNREGRIVVLFLVVLLVVKIFAICYAKKLKGWTGELGVKIGLSRLPKEIYKRFDNVYVPGKEGGVNEIDHVIVSRHGIFVLETKNYAGYLCGTEHGRWKQSFGRRSKDIDNPLLQNKGHIRYLMEHLNMPKNKFHSVICFVGPAVIKTPMPDNVLTRGWAECILSFKEIILSPQDALCATDMLVRLQSGPSLKSKHRRHLQKRGVAVKNARL